MPVYLEQATTDALDVLDTNLELAQKEGVYNLSNLAVVSPAMPGIDRVPETKQQEGRNGVKGLVAAIVGMLQTWVSTRYTIAPGDYQNGFAENNDFNAADPAYYERASNGDIVLGGRVLAPGANQNAKTVFQLPVDYRPAKDLWFVVPTGSTIGWIFVRSTGSVQTGSVSAAAAFSLDGIRFRPA